MTLMLWLFKCVRMCARVCVVELVAIYQYTSIYIVYIFVYLNMLLNRYVQYCKCKGRLREGKARGRVSESGRRQRIFHTWLPARSRSLWSPPPPSTLSLHDLRANDPAGHGTLRSRQWTSTYVCCRQCSVKFALFSNPLSPTVTPPLFGIPCLFVVVAREHVFLLLCCL